MYYEKGRNRCLFPKNKNKNKPLTEISSMQLGISLKTSLKHFWKGKKTHTCCYSSHHVAGQTVGMNTSVLTWGGIVFKGLLFVYSQKRDSKITEKLWPKQHMAMHIFCKVWRYSSKTAVFRIYHSRTIVLGVDMLKKEAIKAYYALFQIYQAPQLLENNRGTGQQLVSYK